MVELKANDSTPLRADIVGQNLLANLTSWGQKTYYTTANFSLGEGQLEVRSQINDTIPAGKAASVYFELTNISVDANASTFFAMRFKQNSGAALILRFGISITDWNNYVAVNQTLASLRWGGSLGSVVWVQYPSQPPTSPGSLEVIPGTDDWAVIGVNWHQYLLGAIHANINQIKGLQIITGFPYVRVSDLQVATIAFQNTPTYSPITQPSPTEYYSVAVLGSQTLTNAYEASLLPERARVIFDIVSTPAYQYVLILAWKDPDGGLHIYRNGFVLQSSPGSKALWVDFWDSNMIHNTKQSIEPFASLVSIMKPGQVAAYILPVHSSDASSLNVRWTEVDLFLSTAAPTGQLSQAPLISQSSNIQDTTVYIVALAVPSTIPLALFRMKRSGYIHSPRLLGAFIAFGLAIRVAIAPVTGHPTDVKQACDMGPLLFRDGRLFDDWVDFPLSYYTLLGTSVPYALATSLGFHDVVYLAMPCASLQMIFVKLGPITADIVSYFFLSKIVGSTRNTLTDMAPELYLLNPITILTSATWAHLNSMFIALAIVGMYYISRSNAIKSTAYSTLSAMVIPVGMASILAPLTLAFRESGRKLLTLSASICAVITAVMFLPGLLSPQFIFALLQRLSTGQVASDPVYDPPSVWIAGEQSQSFKITGYKVFRILEFSHIPLPSQVLTISLVASLSFAAIWFVRKAMKAGSGDSYSGRVMLDLTARYGVLVIGFFLLFFKATNTIWNFWPVPYLLILGITIKSRPFLYLGLAISYIMFFGMDFIERVSSFVTGYSINYYNATGLGVDYVVLNLVISSALSILIIVSIALSIVSRKKPERSQSIDRAAKRKTDSPTSHPGFVPSAVLNEN